MLEKELINLLQEKDENAFNILVNKYQGLVFNTCMGFVHSKDDANDLSQEVFIEVFRSASKFRGDSKISTWLYRISVNKSLNFIRSQKRNSLIKSIDSFFSDRKNHELEISDDNSQQSDYKLHEEDSKKLLKAAFESIPENHRIAFILNKYEELSYKEISEIMDVPLTSVESWIHRAKKGLQKFILKNQNA